MDRYEEALERAKAGKPMDEVFPELKESEDERIRKAIVETIKQCPDTFLNPKNRDKMVSYLEKQKDILGERAKNITANMLEDGIGGIQRELIEFLSNTVNASWVDVIKSADAYAERIRNIIEKQKEQKSIEDVVKKITQNKETATKFLNSAGIMDDNGELAEMYRSEQKPAEKQDYSGLTDLERAILRGFLCAGIENVSVTIIKQTAQDCLSQIKPEEWSEEDEEKCNRLLFLLTIAEVIDSITPSERIELDKFLNSLRSCPKSSDNWKPSKDKESKK